MSVRGEGLGTEGREKKARNDHSCWVMGLGQGPLLPLSFASTVEWSVLNKSRVD